MVAGGGGARNRCAWVSRFISPADQVRFTSRARPSRCRSIACRPVAFTEVMRDVDLFVGIASVGNDQNWRDGGHTGHYHNYWASYSFGELSATAAPAAKYYNLLLHAPHAHPRAMFADRQVPDRSRRSAHLQDPPGQRQYPDGAERPIPLHRPGSQRPRRRQRCLSSF